MNFDISEWEEVSSTSLSDAMLGLHTMESSIKPLNRKMRVVGPAYTVQIIKNDCAVIFKALQEAPEGSVLVIAAQGTTDVAFLGEIVTKIAQKQGIAGIVIDGCIRDSLAIEEGTFPVFAKGAIPKIPAANYLGQVQKTIVCADVIVRPGDIICADADGIVAVPAEKANQVLQKAMEKETKDHWKIETMIPDSEALQSYLDKISKKYKTTP
jgi:4-hydroxy-4-methyl-2-oxoglutarate aldolase